MYIHVSHGFVVRFVALLWSTVGPTEKWLQLLGTLLSSEQTPSAGNEAEEGCGDVADVTDSLGGPSLVFLDDECGSFM